MKENILIVTVNSWDDNKGTGDTLTNLFEGCCDYDFHNIYLKDDFPNNKICKSYFQLNVKSILRSFFKKDVGFSFFAGQKGTSLESTKKQESASFVKKMLS